jgi:hypothetical protein
MRFVSGLLMLFLVAAVTAQSNQRHAKTKPQNKYSRRFNSRLNEDLSSKVRRVLEQAKEFELLSVDPGTELSSPNQSSTLEPNKGETFLGHRVLGKTLLKNARVRLKLLNSLYAGIVHSWEVMGCFRPRHGIRVTYKGQTVELIICFECRVYRGAFGEEELNGKISKAPERIFNQILLSAHVRLSEK